MIHQLLQISQTRPLKLYTSTKDWSETYYQLVKNKPPFERAVLGGFTCQQFSFAFMAGYQAALEKMFPNIAPNELKALCVSETKGGHPKFIETMLLDNRITGLKTYVTLGSDAAHLLVLCKTKEQVDGKPALKIVHLPQTANNIVVTDFSLSFMLEVKHGQLALTDTAINANQILKGDGYKDYTKPFRSLEDILVGAAHQAMLLRQAIDNNWDAEVRDAMFLNLFTLKNLLDLPPSKKETHLLLAANDQGFKKLLPVIESNIKMHTSVQFQTDWASNKKVLSLSEKLKTVRLSKARLELFENK